ncbi:MAG: carbon starvation protein A [candidate division KSB1 bacterium]|nr:carbon starvation protein A [candidate division KSB1 bacterium]
MSGTLLALVALAAFALAYRYYGGMLARRFRLSNSEPTPAHTLYDGVDYVPAKAPVLLGHHFASIAGAGPILGPVIAAAFGWVPVYLWIVLGAIFIGAVHDFGSLVASIRHRGKSIGEIVEIQVGRLGKSLFLIFCWFTLVLVVAVFTRIVATTFVQQPNVATSSLLFIALAILFGLAVYRARMPLWIATAVGVFLLGVSIWLGGVAPLHLSYAVWVVILLIYVLLASVTPVWILLQPRDYLNSYILYALVAGGVAGLFFAAPRVGMPAFTGFRAEIGTLFPILFVTVACGAISGFHSLVASGTSAKQLDRERDALLVGYGAMLIEGVVAVLSILGAASLASDRFAELYRQGAFATIFSESVGGFIARIPVLRIPVTAAAAFAGLAVSAFVLTSLDTATRLARFAFQEFFERGEAARFALLRDRFVGSAVTVAAAWVFLRSGTAHALWPLFGSANQMLAALALLAVTLWLRSLGLRYGVTLAPMVFMFAVTLTALGLLVAVNVKRGEYVLSTAGSVLFLVAALIAVEAVQSLRRTPARGAANP